MSRDRREDGSKDWGAAEVHDWGVPPPPARPDRASVFTPHRVDAPGTGLASSSTGGEDRPVAPEGVPTPEDTSPTGEPYAAAAFLAMENLRHSSARADGDAPGPLEETVGTGDAAVHALPDGRDHVMISRTVGVDADTCVYCLVGRTTIGGFEELRAGDVAAVDAFAVARDLTLCSVFPDPDAANLVVVQTYDGIEDVPLEYRPPSPFLQFE